MSKCNDQDNKKSTALYDINWNIVSGRRSVNSVLAVLGIITAVLCASSLQAQAVILNRCHNSVVNKPIPASEHH